jgi:hypothetical protein
LAISTGKLSALAARSCWSAQIAYMYGFVSRFVRAGAIAVAAKVTGADHDLITEEGLGYFSLRIVCRQTLQLSYHCPACQTLVPVCNGIIPGNDK